MATSQTKRISILSLSSAVMGNSMMSSPLGKLSQRKALPSLLETFLMQCALCIAIKFFIATSSPKT